MKPPKNPNYAATVVKIRTIIPLENCDNVVAAPLLGYQAIVSKDTKVGDYGVLLPPECQLSEDYAAINNLYRHSEFNKDPNIKGYLEDNRRVKALKFRGHRSDALFMPLESLAFTTHLYIEDVLHEGDTFDELNGYEICRKFVRKTKGGFSAAKIEKVTRLDDKAFPRHFETENFFKNRDKFNDDDYVILTQKLHGTSVRAGHVRVARKLSWLEKMAKKFGLKIEEFEYDYVYGSRNVIKDPNNPDSSHFYGADLHTIEGQKLQGLLPKGFVVYGELVGWTAEGKPIQHGYTYNIPSGKAELYVYRVTHLNPDGRATDLSWVQVKEFCDSVGLKYVPDIMYDYVCEINIEWYLDKRFCEYFDDAIPVDDGKVDEGVCIRRDGLRPLILKAKSPQFLRHETKMLDKGTDDIEETS